MSNALCFLSLFAKAEASNKLNSTWPRWRLLAVLLIALNWGSLSAVLATNKRLVFHTESDGEFASFAPLLAVLVACMQSLCRQLHHSAVTDVFAAVSYLV
jgi:hypothetical protein